MQENITTAESTAQLREIPLQFNGKAREYFGIWIVNVLLTILTLGIYAPWAKVRTKRYFYGNTLLADSTFDFVANPVAILKGYLIALGFYIAFSVTSEFYPQVSILFVLVFFLVLPWVVVRSMAFRLANTTYRNIRFNFERDYADAYKVFVGIGLLIPLTLGLIFPYYHYRQSKFVIDKSSFGQSRFGLNAPVGDFYLIYIAIWLLFMLLGVLMVALGPMLTFLFPELAGVEQAVADSPDVDPEQQTTVIMLTFIIIGIISIFYIAIFAYMQTAITNLLWNNISVAKKRFRSKLKTARMIWLYYSNALGIILSFGLLIPWARIRMTRYRVSCMSVLSEGEIGHFIAGEQSQTSATGEELGEVFGVDIGL
ncbi:YjgN family protein [Sulfuriflexus mobilis]|uniref:YjgN family protein n=1 Tax=Sulfuriflexus mobilis TaxID=1811807 RepID=UPI000F83B990|nr:YjgN family protein [Sulfuriflexus mobilis]